MSVLREDVVADTANESTLGLRDSRKRKLVSYSGVFRDSIRGPAHRVKRDSSGTSGLMSCSRT